MERVSHSETVVAGYVDAEYDVSVAFATVQQEIEMATEKEVVVKGSEIGVVLNALVAMEKSVMRLAAKEGQPETVAAEYRKVAKQLGDLMRKFV